MEGIHNVIASMVYLGGRALLVLLFIVGLRYIGITDPQAITAILVLMVLMMLFRRKTATMVMAFVFLWSLCAYLEFAPNYQEIHPVFSNGYQHLKTAFLTALPIFAPATSQVQTAREQPAGNASVQAAPEKSGKNSQLLAAVDAMVQNGSIRTEDAENLKLAIDKQQTEEPSPQAPTQE